MQCVQSEENGAVLNYGLSNYVYQVSEMEEDEYIDYQNILMDAGFEKYMENTEGIKGHFYSATFLKNDIVVTVTYWKTIKRLYVSGSLTYFRDVQTAEIAFEGIPTYGLCAEHKGDGVYMKTWINCNNLLRIGL